jgi:ATP-dependent Lhr-like helicase
MEGGGAGVAQRDAGAASGLASLRAWLAERGWTPFPFQEQAWAAHQRRESGLINVPTGAGKTYAAYLGPLADLIEERQVGAVTGLRILFITPLRAVSRDIEKALKAPVADLGIKIKVESRTGDTSSSIRARQKKELPQVLITTPESLSLLLSQDNAAALFAGLRSIIVDEWHELLATKRGTQTELALARLRRLAPGLRTWALSATLANLDEAAGAVVGAGPPPPAPSIIRARIDRPVVIETVIADPADRIPWAGHMGLSMLPDLLRVLDPERATLIFTNTRAQAELWYQAIRYSKPEWAPIMGLHHGSIDRDDRERIERGLKTGTVRLVVCTSSLDLGVDFAPVERVVQIGSPKGVARLLQRAGRSGHRPGETAHIICLPTHGMELVEVAAVRRAIAEGEIEPRLPLRKPLDVLAQHLVTCALGGGFEADAMYDEVRSAWTYRDLAREEFDWALSLVREGGGTLKAYPEFNKVRLVDGLYRVPERRVAQLHRLNVGTITGDATMHLRYASGRNLGSIEEYFIAQLSPGDRFFFSGRVLEFVRATDMDAIVRPARGKTSFTPHWSGTKLPISESLSEEMRRVIGSVHPGARPRERELAAIMPLLEIQARWSRLPREDQVLIELTRTREGNHLFVFPFEGRLVHGGLAALIALRLSRTTPATFSMAVSDYGLEVLTSERFDFEPHLGPALFSEENLAHDALESANVSALARRQFREIARIAGLVFPSYPGARKSARQLQVSSSLLFDVFSEFDPANLLLEQARREVLERQFEQSRLGRTLRRLRESERVIVRTERPTPFSFPLVLERLGSNTNAMSSEKLEDRIERMRREWTR